MRSTFIILTCGLLVAVLLALLLTPTGTHAQTNTTTDANTTTDPNATTTTIGTTDNATTTTDNATTTTTTDANTTATSVTTDGNTTTTTTTLAPTTTENATTTTTLDNTTTTAVTTVVSTTTTAPTTTSAPTTSDANTTTTTTTSETTTTTTDAPTTTTEATTTTLMPSVPSDGIPFTFDRASVWNAGAPLSAFVSRSYSYILKFAGGRFVFDLANLTAQGYKWYVGVTASCPSSNPTCDTSPLEMVSNSRDPDLPNFQNVFEFRNNGKATVDTELVLTAHFVGGGKTFPESYFNMSEMLVVGTTATATVKFLAPVATTLRVGAWSFWNVIATTATQSLNPSTTSTNLALGFADPTAPSYISVATKGIIATVSCAATNPTCDTTMIIVAFTNVTTRSYTDISVLGGRESECNATCSFVVTYSFEPTYLDSNIEPISGRKLSAFYDATSTYAVSVNVYAGAIPTTAASTTNVPPTVTAPPDTTTPFEIIITLNVSTSLLQFKQNLGKVLNITDVNMIILTAVTGVAGGYKLSFDVSASTTGVTAATLETKVMALSSTEWLSLGAATFSTELPGATTTAAPTPAPRTILGVEVNTPVIAAMGALLFVACGAVIYLCVKRQRAKKEEEAQQAAGNEGSGGPLSAVETELGRYNPGGGGGGAAGAHGGIGGGAPRPRFDRNHLDPSI